MTREEAIRRIKAWNLDSDDMEILSAAIPELAENEDERIRKEIIDHLVREVGLYPGVDRKEHKWLRWLEKQKEQKPIEPSDEELQRHQDELYNFKVFAAKQAKEYHISYVHDFEWNNFCAEILSYFNEQKPVEWNEFDEDCLKRAIWYVENPAPSVVKDTNLALWLKSIRLYWKPSKEQMGALNYAYCELFKREDVGHNILGPLQNLIDTLSKL